MTLGTTLAGGLTRKVQSHCYLVECYLGDQQYFFTGDHIGEHVCTCGLDNSCLNVEGVERQCNCDARVPDWANDEGIITAKEILPIQSVAYGPLAFASETANFTIGPLKCSGK